MTYKRSSEIVRVQNTILHPASVILAVEASRRVKKELSIINNKSLYSVLITFINQLC